MTRSTDRLSTLLGIQQRAIEAEDRNTLSFLIANDTWHLIPYRQAVVFTEESAQRAKLRAITGLVSTLTDTPYNLWLKQLEATLKPTHKLTAHTFSSADLPEQLREQWQEWWPDFALRLPLVTPGGQYQGCVYYVREQQWHDAEVQFLDRVHRHYAYCMASLSPHRKLMRRLLPTGRLRWVAGVTLAAVVALALIPVRLSVLAPAEVISLQSELVSSPMDGVVKAFHVEPNSEVTAGQLLFSLDDTTLRNRRDVAAQALVVARTEALAMDQRAFDSQKSRADLAALRGRVQEKESELAYLTELLSRVEVRAAQDGVFIFGSKDEWLGKPVATGERIGMLAEPGNLGVQVWVPVADAISLEPGAEMRVYLQTAPLDSLGAELSETSYQASLSPDNIASYRIRGTLTEPATVHIGLRGVAKVYGERKPALYWILRRPLGTLRQWTGL